MKRHFVEFTVSDIYCLQEQIQEVALFRVLPVSTMMMSLAKSGPSSSAMERIMLPFFGLPPLRLSWVNCSSGPSITWIQTLSDRNS